DQALADREVAETLTYVDVDVYGGLEAELRVVRRQRPLKLFVECLVGLDEAAGSVLDLLYEESVERVHERHATTVTIERERHGQQLGSERARYLRQSVAHDVDAR